MSDDATRGTGQEPDVEVHHELLEPILGEASVGTPRAAVFEPAGAALPIDDDGD